VGAGSWSLVRGTTRTAVRTAAIACIAGGAIGVVAYLFEGLSPPGTGVNAYNYPIPPDTYVAVQALYGVQHLALAYGLLGLLWTRAVPRSSLGTPSAYAAVGSVGLLAVAQFAAIGAVETSQDAYYVYLLDESFGFVSAAVGLSLFLAGVAVVWGRRWPAPWRYLPLVLGGYVFLPLIPVVTAPMSLAPIVLAGWMSLFVLLGVAMLRFNPYPRRVTVTRSTGQPRVEASDPESWRGLRAGEGERARPPEAPPGSRPTG
jgi:hypothetical protein